MPQSGYGRIRVFNDFLGAEIPVANAVGYVESAIERGLVRVVEQTPASVARRPTRTGKEE